MIYDAYGKPIAIARELAIGYGRASIMEALGLEYKNPDAIAREKGLEYYDEVARDPHVKSVWGTRIMALVGCQREFQAASDAPIDRAVQSFVAWVFADFLKQRGLDTIVEQSFRSATKNGYTVQEVIWQPRHARGTVIADIKDRDPERFIIKPDGLYLKRHIWDIDGDKQPPRKFAVQAFEPEYENPYGASLMQTIHWYVWFKKHGMKFWMIFLEKFGMPTVLAKVPEGFSDDNELRRVRDVLDSIQQRTNITVPAGFEISLLEAAKSGSAGAGYDILCSTCDAQISKAILGQTLTTQEGKTSGSYALGQVHNEVRSDILIADGKWFDSFLNWQIVTWLVDYNFRVQAYPYCVTQTEPGADLRAQCEIDEKLVAMGVKLTQQYFYAKYNRPAPQPGEAVVGGGAPAAASETAKPQAFAEKKKVSPADALFDAALATGADVFRNTFILPLQRLVGELSDFAALKLRLDDEAHPVADFSDYFANVLITANVLGRWVVQQRAQLEKFADLDVDILREPLPPEQVAAFVAAKGVMSPQAYAHLSEEAKRVAFTIAGIQDEGVIALVREQLAEAIRLGWTYEEFADVVDGIFAAYNVTGVTNAHLETLFRTNVQSAYQQGAYEMLHDPAVEGLIAYLVYDAIEDSRTCHLCAALDGVTLPLDDPFWTTFWPPNHHRCRCDVRPVTRFEAARGNYREKRPPQTVVIQLPSGRLQRIPVYPADGFATAPRMGGE